MEQEEIRKNIKNWQTRLINTTANNRLINFKFDKLPKDCLYLPEHQHCGPTNMSDLVSELVQNKEGDPTQDLYKKIQEKLEHIRKNSKTVKKEKGFDPLYFAFGFFEYKDKDIVRYAPIFLIPARIDKRNNGILQVLPDEEGGREIIFNEAIKKKFNKEFDVNLDTDVLQNSLPDNIMEGLCKLEGFLRGNLKNIKVSESKKWALGCFNSSKATLYEELKRLEDEIVKHELIDTIFSGRGSSAETIGDDKLDTIPSKDLFCLFPFDSSQGIVIETVKAGKNIVIQGPPGTGKSQTISNIIAELVGAGKKVLFVAEKKAAIDAVLKNFKNLEEGLKHLFLDLHDNKTATKEIAKQIEDSASYFHETRRSRVDESCYIACDEIRDKLNHRDSLMHSNIKETNLSPFKVFAKLSKLREVQDLDVKFDKPASKINLNDAIDTLKQSIRYYKFYENRDNPWVGIIEANKLHPQDGEAIKQMFNDNEELMHKLDTIKSDKAWLLYEKPKFYSLMPFWHFKAELWKLNKSEKKTNIEIKKNDRKIRRLIRPVDESYLLRAKSCVDTITDAFEYLRIKKRIHSFGITSIWNAVMQSKIRAEDIECIFSKHYYKSLISEIDEENGSIISDTKLHSERIEDFVEKDQQNLRFNRVRLIEEIKSRIRIDNVEYKKIINNRKKSKPRKFISKYLHVIQNITPCVVCSPLTICNFFEIKEIHNPMFDVVIFDEASQIYQEEAIASIIRAKQVVIAGDKHQMPPTDYFNNKRDSEEDDLEEDECEIEEAGNSLLDLGDLRLKNLSLEWHYRSKYEELITPSNREIYRDKLITVPNASKEEKPIEYHYISDGFWQNQKNPAHVGPIIDLLKDLKSTNKLSVGVITVNKKQQWLIETELEKDTSLRDWLDMDGADGLFVKNLENCQGDERDIIVVCIPYSTQKEGGVRGTMFKHVRGGDGLKRLNVMFTRAREKVHIFTSIRSQDIKLTKPDVGLGFLKEYLSYAETGVFSSRDQRSTGQDGGWFDSDFEMDVCDAIKELGYKCVSQVGCSVYRIDLAVEHEDRYILGIECDGDMYHSGRTARERDKIRQEVLESKGWAIHRIWASDWNYSRQEELMKIKEKLNNIMHSKA